MGINGMAAYALNVAGGETRSTTGERTVKTALDALRRGLALIIGTDAGVSPVGRPGTGSISGMDLYAVCAVK
jgi:imidazolonepropionase-like amidohydrolase